MEASTRSLVVLSAGLSTPSSTRMLADLLADATRRDLESAGEGVDVRVVELREYARDALDAMLSRFPSSRLQDVVDAIRAADAVIAVTPIYNTAASGLFTTFLDAVDMDVWEGKPVLIGATAGSVRHSLALEYGVRPMFVYLKADLAPTGVFAATGDFGAADAAESDVAPLTSRARRAGGELAQLVRGRAGVVDSADDARSGAQAAADTEKSGGTDSGRDEEFDDFVPMDQLLGGRGR